MFTSTKPELMWSHGMLTLMFLQCTHATRSGKPSSASRALTCSGLPYTFVSATSPSLTSTSEKTSSPSVPSAMYLRSCFVIIWSSIELMAYITMTPSPRPPRRAHVAGWAGLGRCCSERARARYDVMVLAQCKFDAACAGDKQDSQNSWCVLCWL